MQHKGKDAAAEFRKVTDHKGAAWYTSAALGRGIKLLYPLSYLGLARAYTTLGDVETAKHAYAEALDSWKSADRDFKPAIEARTEYPRLLKY